jgi:hypothetical protein
MPQTVNTGIAILDRVLQPDAAFVTPGAARAFLSLRFQQRDLRRMNQLAAKARRGSLTAAEQAEAEQYNLVGHLLAILHAKARSTLDQKA